QGVRLARLDQIEGETERTLRARADLLARWPLAAHRVRRVADRDPLLIGGAEAHELPADPRLVTDEDHVEPELTASEDRSLGHDAGAAVAAHRVDGDPPRCVGGHRGALHRRQSATAITFRPR